jgi:hypothetical protein
MSDGFFILYNYILYILKNNSLSHSKFIKIKNQKNMIAFWNFRKHLLYIYTLIIKLDKIEERFSNEHYK